MIFSHFSPLLWLSWESWIISRYTLNLIPFLPTTAGYLRTVGAVSLPYSTRLFGYAFRFISPIDEQFRFFIAELGLFLLWWTHSTMQGSWTPVIQIKDSHKLITEG